MISDFMLAEIRFPWVLIIAVALFLWRKHSKLKEILEGTAKALLGYFMVVIGASVIPVTTAPLSALMQGAFGINGGVMNSEAYSAALLAEFGPAALMVMFCAFAINLLLAKFTRLKGVYLTGHH
jgi:PTS system ascorbate-specific IIC component